MAGLGQPKTGGRQKGTQNKISTDVRAIILGALNDVGGKDYLAKHAKESPCALMTLIGKVLPTQTHLSGPNEEPIQMSIEEKTALAVAAIDEAFREVPKADE